MRASRQAVAVVAIAALAVGLGGALILTKIAGASDSTYFEQPSGAGLGGIGADGERFYLGLGQLDIQPGDAVRFMGVDGVPGTARLLSVRLQDTDAAIGVLQEQYVTDAFVYHDLAGVSYTSADGPLQVLALVQLGTSDLDFSLPTLSFSVNGGPVQHERLLTSVRICSTAQHADGACEPPPAPGE